MSDNEERFWSKVIPEPMSGCWLWGGYTQKSGHGKAAIGGRGKVDYAHRVVWRWERGPIPDGHDIHHLCENPSCVNTDHLQALPMVEHRKLTIQLMGPQGAAAKHAAKTTCRRGHPFDGWNGKQRTCRTCSRRAKREHAARKRAGREEVAQ